MVEIEFVHKPASGLPRLLIYETACRPLYVSVMRTITTSSRPRIRRWPWQPTDLPLTSKLGRQFTCFERSEREVETYSHSRPIVETWAFFHRDPIGWVRSKMASTTSSSHEGTHPEWTTLIGRHLGTPDLGSRCPVHIRARGLRKPLRECCFAALAQAGCLERGTTVLRLNLSSSRTRPKAQLRVSRPSPSRP